MKTTLIIILLAMSALSFAEEIYKWVDEEGVVHYGSTPPVHAKLESIKNRMTEYSAADSCKNMMPRIVVYSTSWCSVCKQAKAYLDDNNIPYVEYDVEQSAYGKREYEKLNVSGVPAITIGDQLSVGFDAKEIEIFIKDERC